MSIATLNEALRSASPSAQQQFDKKKSLDESTVGDLWVDETEASFTSALFDFSPTFSTINCSRGSTCNCASAGDSLERPVDFEL